MCISQTDYTRIAQHFQAKPEMCMYYVKETLTLESFLSDFRICGKPAPLWFQQVCGFLFFPKRTPSTQFFINFHITLPLLSYKNDTTSHQHSNNFKSEMQTGVPCHLCDRFVFEILYSIDTTKGTQPSEIKTGQTPGKRFPWLRLRFVSVPIP